MRFALVDDIEEVRSRMAQLIEEFAQQHHFFYQLDSFASGEAFLEAFEAHRYDIVFLDIYMDGIGGTEVAERIRETDQYVLLIFLTSSRDHMGDAFSCHAFDYLEKPVDEEKISRCLLDALKVIPNKEQYFSFSFNNMEVRMPYSDIVCLYADNHCTKVYDISGKEYLPRIYYSTLSAQLTHDERFLQVSRGILCNMDHILELTKRDCTLAGNLTVPITLRNATQLKRKWRDYEFSKIRRNTGGRST